MRRVARICAGLGLMACGAAACASSVKTYEHPGTIPAATADKPALGKDWEGVSYFLPRRRMLLTVTANYGEPANGCKAAYQVVLTLLPVEPDPRHIYQAKLRHHWSRDDEITITTNEQGLLSSTKLTTTDRTGDILVEIAGAVGAFLGPPPGPMPMTAAKDEPGRCPKPFTVKQIFDPVSPKELHAANRLLRGRNIGLRICVDGRWSADGGPCSPTVMDLGPCTDPGCRNERDDAWREQARRAKDSGGSNRRLRRLAKRADGLLYRRMLPHVIEIQEQGAASGGWSTSEAQLVLLPNAGPISVVPFRAGPLVKTVYDVEFKDGILTKWDAKRPSELLEVARLPVRILKSLISVPAEIFQLRVNLTQKQTSLLNEQAKQIEAMRKLIELQRQLAEQAKKASQGAAEPDKKPDPKKP